MRAITKIFGAVAALAALVVAAAGCGDSASGGGSGKLNLVAYSTPQEAYEQIIPAFQRSAAGRGVSFKQSFGASGDQARAVAAGLPADVVALSLEPDVQKLVKAGAVAAGWKDGAYHGMVTDSVVTFVVRRGNPKHIRTWSDLVRDGVEVITPNPFTSGGARWNVMAAYGAQIEQGRTPAQALAYLGELFKHVAVQDKSARESLQTFVAGKGDVLLAYENEAITAQRKGEKVDYVTPAQTILIENPVAVTKNAGDSGAARAFVRFLRSAPAQRIFAANGYRPVLRSALDARRFPTPPGLFRIGALGGWSKVTDEFFDPEQGKVADLERKLGVSTG